VNAPRLKVWASWFRTQVPFRAKLGSRTPRPRRAKAPRLPRGNHQVPASLNSRFTPPPPDPSRYRCCCRNTPATTGGDPKLLSQRGELLQHPVRRLPLEPLHQAADRHLRRDRNLDSTASSPPEAPTAPPPAWNSSANATRGHSSVGQELHANAQPRG
jgi:hypothetical protein